MGILANEIALEALRPPIRAKAKRMLGKESPRLYWNEKSLDAQGTGQTKTNLLEALQLDLTPR
jgi:hypothetical protein